MKKILVLVLLLAFVPANAFGVSLALTSGGSSNINIDKTVAGGIGSITVSFDLATTEEVTGYTTKLKASHAGVLNATARTLQAGLTDATTADGALLPLAIGTAWSASDVGASKPLGGTGPSSDAAVAVWTIGYNVSGLAVGTVVTLTPGLPGGPPLFQDILGGRWTNASNVSANMSGGTPLSITVTPEPMSAILLLAAVPFMWRRRVA